MPLLCASIRSQMPFLHPQTETPSNSVYEAFVLNDLSGATEVRQLKKYEPAENEAAELFRRPPPNSLKEMASYFEACDQYVQRHTELAECPKFAPKLACRFRELKQQLNRCTELPRASDITEEACSMVASLVLRLAPAGAVAIKRYGTPPGNVPEMLDFLDGEDGALARKIDRMRPDARAQITEIYDESLKNSQYFNTPHRHLNYGPPPDELIIAARTGVAFDKVRRRMLPVEASAETPLGNNLCGVSYCTKYR